MPINDLKFIGLTRDQITFSKKSLLYSEMEFLTAIKHFKNYKNLREKEFAAKNLMKKALLGFQKELKNLDSYIPEVPLEKDSLGLSSTIKKRETLDLEIEDLKKKIADLR